MTEKTESPVAVAWRDYQEAAKRDPYSAETKRAHTRYARALTAARKKRASR